MVYCINCGKQNITDFDFCYNCGAKLVKSTETDQAEPTSGAATPTGQNPDLPAASPPNPPPPPPASPYNQPSGPGWNPPGFSGGSGQANPNFRPPYPYGYPPIPRRGETQRFPVAANGKPYVVIDHPEAFYEYKTAEGKQVYASFATMQARIMASIFDVCLLYLPLQTIAVSILVSVNQEVMRKLETLTTSPDQSQIQEINSYMPGWATLAIFTITLLYSTLMTWRGGQTLGKKVLRIKVIGKDGRPPTFQAALTRNLFGYAYGLGTVAFMLNDFGTIVGFFLQLMVFAGFSAAFFNRQRRGWHDRLAETYVVGKNELVQGVNY